MVGGNGMSDVNNLLENAVMETKNVLPGEEFLLRDLFKDIVFESCKNI